MLDAESGGRLLAAETGSSNAPTSRALGFANATTSAHGAHSPWLSDWSPLAGWRVAILGDEDEDGAGYASKVASLLSDLSPPPTVVTVRLDGISDGEDIEQWAASRRTASSPRSRSR